MKKIFICSVMCALLLTACGGSKKTTYDFTGKITLSCVTNKDIVCEISFYEERKDSPIGKFDGKITNKDEVVYLLGGNWKQELCTAEDIRPMNLKNE